MAEGGGSSSGGSSSASRRLLKAAILLLSLPATAVWASTATATEAAAPPNPGKLRASADEAFTRG
jgi:hypothetical protein